MVVPVRAEPPVTKASNRPLIVFAAVHGGALVVALGFYAWVLATRPEKAFFWAMMGDVAGPFAALFSAFALFSALWAVHLQRRELELQREELREGREVMEEQKRQLERTAKAQTLLGIVTAALALEQREANRLAWFAELAQRRATLASLHASIADIAVASASIEGAFEAFSADQESHRSREYLEILAAEENQRIRFLERKLAVNQEVSKEDAWAIREDALPISEDPPIAKEKARPRKRGATAREPPPVPYSESRMADDYKPFPDLAKAIPRTREGTDERHPAPKLSRPLFS
jgi:hypothetical protein